MSHEKLIVFLQSLVFLAKYLMRSCVLNVKLNIGIIEPLLILKTIIKNTILGAAKILRTNYERLCAFLIMVLKLNKSTKLPK